MEHKQIRLIFKQSLSIVNGMIEIFTDPSCGCGFKEWDRLPFMAGVWSENNVRAAFGYTEWKKMSEEDQALIQCIASKYATKLAKKYLDSRKKK